LAAQFAAEVTPKGEIVILIGPPGDEKAAVDDAAIDALLRARLLNHSVKDAVTLVVQETGLPKKRVYARALTLSGDRP
jgi:16S rRNA (cytidine1402-2'-O)-methyltransferase